MASEPRPPRRPPARAMLDAASQQKVGQAAKPRKSPQPNHSDTKTRPSSVPPRSSRPAAQKPGPSSESSRRTIRIHSKRDSLKWSFGGLTVSVRLLVTLTVVGILAVTLVPLGLQWVKQEQAYRAILAEVANTEQRAQDLRDELVEWDDDDFIAGQARDRLGYVRPGETQFVVTDAPPEQEDPAQESLHNNLDGPDKPWMWYMMDSIRDADQPPASSRLKSSALAVDSGPEEEPSSPEGQD